LVWTFVLHRLKDAGQGMGAAHEYR
jgi:hypothetical protein